MIFVSPEHRILFKSQRRERERRVLINSFGLVHIRKSSICHRKHGGGDQTQSQLAATSTTESKINPPVGTFESFRKHT
jgi:hypothetical protein